MLYVSQSLAYVALYIQVAFHDQYIFYFLSADIIVIGFQNASYTFPEPQDEMEIFGVIFRERKWSYI